MTKAKRRLVLCLTVARHPAGWHITFEVDVPGILCWTLRHPPGTYPLFGSECQSGYFATN